MRLNLLAFCLGIVIVAQLPGLPAISVLLLAAVVLAGFGLRLRVFLLAASLCAGMAWHAWAAQQWLDQKLSVESALADHPHEVIVEIVGIPESRSWGTRFIGKLYCKEGAAGCAEAGTRLRVHWPDNNTEIRPGQIWQLPLQLKSGRQYSNPNSFDVQRWQLSTGIHARVGVVQHAPPRLLATSDSGLHALRYQIRSALQARLPDGEARAIYLALLLGDRSEINDRLWETLRLTGTVHLVAISGFHIGLIASITFILAGAAVRRMPFLLSFFPAQYYVSAVTLLTSACYALLAGWSLPTQRAFIMIACIVMATLLNRRLLLWDGFLFALFIVLLLQPLSVLSASFYLSFGAVALILWVLANRVGPRRPLLSFIRVQLALYLGLMPILFLYWQTQSLFSPLVNAVAIPLLSFVLMPAILIGLLSAALPGDAFENYWDVLSNATAFGLEQLHALAALPYASFSLPYLMPILLLSVLLATLWWAAPRAVPARCLALLLLLPAFLYRPAEAPLEIVVFETDGAPAVLVAANGKQLLYGWGNTGRRWSRVFENQVLPELQGLALDRLLVPDSGLANYRELQRLRQELVIEEISSSWLIPGMSGAQWRPCRERSNWSWGEVDFMLLSAPPEREVLRGLCLLRISYGKQHYLLIPALSTEQELALVDYFGSTLQASTLLTPHKHAGEPASVAFVNRVDADQVLYVSSPHHNSAKTRVAARRYALRNAKIFDTAFTGALFVSANSVQDDPVISSNREQRGNYWREY